MAQSRFATNVLGIGRHLQLCGITGGICKQTANLSPSTASTEQKFDAQGSFQAISFLVWHIRCVLLASDLAVQLEGVRAALRDKNTVCFLGKAQSGKTVSSTLLKHAIINHFIPGRMHDYQAIVSQGMDTINRHLVDMIIEGQFPTSALPVSGPRVVLDVYKMSGPGAGKFEIILQDSSCENFFECLVKECPDPAGRLREMLEPSGSGHVGPLACYIFAKLYILAIDCSAVATLEQQQSSLANAITTLHRLHTAASLTRNNKVVSPIAILFTKADLLSGDDSSYTATELLERMPELKSALDVLHEGTLDCFKVSISTQEESEDDRSKRVARAKQRHEREYTGAVVKRRSADEANSAMCAQERSRAEAEIGGADLEAHMRQHGEKQRRRIDSELPLPAKFDYDAARNAQTRRPELPLAYTHDEYVRLIMWIISQMVGSAWLA